MVLFLALTLCSCSPTLDQKDTVKEKIVQAQEAINQENYSEAISILSSLDEKDYQVSKLKAIAHAGRAGIKTLSIVDLIENNKNENPGVLIALLAEKYGETNLNDSKMAIDIISRFSESLESRTKELNFLYAIVQLYKASQIILKKADLAQSGKISQAWDPCLEAYLLSIDIEEIIVSINKAVKALYFSNNDLYQKALKIQEDLILNAQALEAQLLSNEDVNHLRNYLNQYVKPQSQALKLGDLPPEVNNLCPNLADY